MRIKISFLKVHGSNGLVPLHHQKIISAFMEEVIRELPIQSEFYNFSSLKGTSKVQNGQIRFLSSKISLVISAPEKEFVDEWVKKIFERRLVCFGKLALVPKAYQVIPDPEFKTVMKYVCISPLVAQPPFVSEEGTPDPMDPRTQEISDLFFETILNRMEQAGFTEKQLNEFAEFEITPDPVYIERLIAAQKKFARIYKNNLNQTIFGYLLPFALHAHPQVHKFIWDCGMGLFTLQGYGMIDVVADEVIVPEVSEETEMNVATENIEGDTAATPTEPEADI